MDFGLLGPVAVRRAGRPVAVRSLRQRTVLAMLLVHANEVVPVEALIDALWEDRPPRTARNALQAHVGALRGRLSERPDRGLIRTVPRGYQLLVDRDRLDTARFADLVRAARAARDAGRPDRAAADLRAALALWRGPALADVPSA
ncbi:MAG TPA: winged helix-turn-helix domain-containing protein, partial [Mycobacteriales bacterium]|nr:winged helix-turn-helix domain-containing protein [Mycobacteriales bacterium]